MGKLHLSYVSILHDKIRPLKFRSKDIVCGGGDGGGAEQHVCKVILVISLSLSQAEQKFELLTKTPPLFKIFITFSGYNFL